MQNGTVPEKVSSHILDGKPLYSDIALTRFRTFFLALGRITSTNYFAEGLKLTRFNHQSIGSGGTMVMKFLVPKGSSETMAQVGQGAPGS